MPRYKVVEDNKPYHYSPILRGTNDFSDPSLTTGISEWSLLNSSTIAHEGGQLKVTSANTTGGAQSTRASVSANEKKIFKFKVRGTGASIGKFIRGKITANGDDTFQDTVAVKLTSSLQEVWCTYVIPATGTVTLSIYGVDLANTEIFYIDDVVFDTYQIPLWSVSGRYILFNGQRTWWRGCNYNNTPTEDVGSTNVGTEEKMLRFDAQDLVDQGVNCVRIYMGTWTRNDYGRALDVFYQYGITVQAWYFIWIQGADYTQITGVANRQSKIDDYVVWVNRLKNHPSICSYFFGSEGNYHVTDEGPGANNTQTDWITLVNECSRAAKAEDPLRLTSTSHGGVNDLIYDALVPDMDFWGYTIYRGSSQQIHRWSTINSIGSEILAKTSKPAILTEIGVGVYNAAAPSSRDYWGQGLSDLSLLKRCESFSEYLQGTMYFQFEDRSNDTSMYGIADSVDGGSSAPRPKRLAWDLIKQYYTSSALPI